MSKGELDGRDGAVWPPVVSVRNVCLALSVCLSCFVSFRAVAGEFSRFDDRPSGQLTIRGIFVFYTKTQPRRLGDGLASREGRPRRHRPAP